MRRALALIVGFAAFVILLPAVLSGLTSASSGSWPSPRPRPPGPHEIRPPSEVRPDGAVTPTITREITLMGIPLTATLTTVVGLHGYVFPLALSASSIAIAVWDLIRREELRDRRRIGWMAPALIVEAL